MAAYAYYKAAKYDDAISSADRYLTLHPGTQESDLAQDIISNAIPAIDSAVALIRTS